ncbi:MULTISPECIES: flavin reductase family protein [unclassified Streptomyces]|uniref:flavin reductase family protein n=1 Tax=unclassified Streptomyces TaxID=2593676 RepID=UPI0035E1FD33
MPASTATPPQTSTDAPDAATFRSVLGQVPTAVSVVTAVTPKGPVGVTVGSFTSVSLDPPLVVFYGGLHSASAAAVVAAGSFCVNVLSQDQQQVCGAFAGRTGDRFASCTWQPAGNGAPRLDGATAWIECDVEESFPAGDHLAVIGRVRHLSTAREQGLPLIFHRGRLTRLDPACGRHVPTQRFDWWDA